MLEQRLLKLLKRKYIANGDEILGAVYVLLSLVAHSSYYLIGVDSGH